MDCCSRLGQVPVRNQVVLVLPETTQPISPSPSPPPVATKFPDLPANVSYNTQGALDKPPLDVSNVMD
ncbi:hypothetical protein DSO57_1026410 [Entomophthora muscae]|uniref:Uncharacterized protein n=1 Tax=Entomophthora muscae TaxID=34485 RepID=A0ACC2UMR3_9FUNG|nr:hypothetical protein DSO57_1026410 [Entomophthora muscae]